MPAPRRLTPELLDSLPEHDPRAIASRADLRRVNAWMGQAGLMARLLRQHSAVPHSMLELGCGDGTFMLAVARRLAPQWPGIRLRLVDRQDLVTSETLRAYAALGWHAEPVIADVFAALDQQRAAPVDIVSVNLFLHHFEGEPLARLLDQIAAVTGFLATCEPRRAPLAALGCRLMILIGCNQVTRHDAAVSVQAGFTGQELSALWPAAGWKLHESAAGLFTHCFTAARSEPAPV